MDKTLEIISISNYVCDKANDFNKRVDIALKGIAIYESSKKSFDNNYLIYVYKIYRELGSLYFQTNQNYVESERYFEKSIALKRKAENVDNLINECITKQMLCKNKLMLYLNTEDKHKLDEAYDLMNFIRDNDIDNKLKDKLEELEIIYNSIINDDLKTIVNFVVPTHIILDEEKNIDFIYNNTLCSINAKTIRNTNSLLIDGPNLYTEKDKYGIINRSLISVTIGKYINPNELVVVNKEVKQVYKPLFEAIEIYNYFIKNYIISTGKYWTPEINEKMIFNYEVKVYAKSIEIKNIPLSMSIELSSSNNPIALDSLTLGKIKKTLNNVNINLWELAYNNAKDYFLIKDYKNSKIMINIALENFLYSFAKKFLINYVSENDLEKFLNGIADYNNYFLKDYMDEKSFNMAKSAGVIKDNPPTIYRICNECYKYGKLKMTKTQLLKKISIIKNLRNDIVHGVDIKENLQFAAEKSIESFEEIFTSLVE